MTEQPAVRCTHMGSGRLAYSTAAYGSGEADPVVPPDDGRKNWHTFHSGKFPDWGVVPGTTGQIEAPDDYTLFVYR